MTKAQRKAQIRVIKQQAERYKAGAVFTRLAALNELATQEARQTKKHLSTVWLKKHRTNPAEFFHPHVTANG